MFTWRGEDMWKTKLKGIYAALFRLVPSFRLRFFLLPCYFFFRAFCIFWQNAEKRIWIMDKYVGVTLLQFAAPKYVMGGGWGEGERTHQQTTWLERYGRTTSMFKWKTFYLIVLSMIFVVFAKNYWIYYGFFFVALTNVSAKQIVDRDRQYGESDGRIGDHK